MNRQAGFFGGVRGFARLTLVAAVVTFLMIVIGAITRVTESGLGCGPQWPLCNDLIIPEFHDYTVAWEFGHRVFALIVGVFSVWVAVRAWREYRSIPRVYNVAMLGLVLFFVQSGLGAITVWMYRIYLNAQWISVMLHLGNSMFLLAAYLALWVNVRSLMSADQDSLGEMSRGTSLVVIPPMAIYLAAALSFLVAMVGAAVAGTNATHACIGWPLCDGEILPVNQGPLQMLNMLHRLIVGGFGLTLCGLVVMAYQARGVKTPLRNALLLAGAVYLLQSALGALVVLVNDQVWLVMSRSLHVAFAALTWAAMITASGIAWLQVSPNVVRAPATPTPSVGAPSATISS